MKVNIDDLEKRVRQLERKDDDLEKRVRRLGRKDANLDMVIEMLKQQNEVYNRLKKLID